MSRLRYTIQNSKNITLTTINPGVRDTDSTSLVLHGHGAPEYGLEQDQNLVYLLEHFANSTPPDNPIDGQLWWKIGDQLYVWNESGSPGSWDTIIPPPLGLGFIVGAGKGLTGGGFPTLSPLQTVLNVGAGTGITVTADAISTNDSEIVHDNLSGFVSNEHINHSSVILTAGSGLVGGGDITTSRRFDIVAGDGIIVGSPDVAVDETVIRTGGSPEQIIGGIKTFTAQIRGDTGSPPLPSYAFEADRTTGMYRSNSNEISFVTGGQQRFSLLSTGVLRTKTVNYDTLVTEDDDIPNKKYVDDTIGAGVSNPTANTFVGTSSLSGLDGNQTYLVCPYGIVPFKGTGSTTCEAIEIYTGSTTPGAGTLRAATGSRFINWPDGAFPTLHNFIVDMSGDTTLNCIVNRIDAFGTVPCTYIIAVQLTDN